MWEPACTVRIMTKSPDSIPLYASGAWTTSPNPLAGYDDGPHLDKTMKKAGFADFAYLSHLGPLRVTLWRRENASLSTGTFRFMVCTETPHGTELVAVDGWVDTMDLLARWAPALQASAISDLTSWAESNDKDGNPFVGAGAWLETGARSVRKD